MNIQSLDEAGMQDEQGRVLSGSLPFSKIRLPTHIDLTGDGTGREFIYWRDESYLTDAKSQSTDPSGALNAFIKLKSDKDILHFAKRYGPLGLCKHGLPPRHRGRWGSDVIKEGELVGVTDTDKWNPGNGERGWCPPNLHEAVERWLFYSELALDILVNAGKVKIGEKETFPKDRKLFIKAAISSNPVKRFFIQDRINEWLGDAGIGMVLDWQMPEPRFVLAGGGLFGALGVQLLMAVTDNTLAICSGCNQPYLREGRQPQRGRHNFCPACQGKVADKLRQRAHRQK